METIAQKNARLRALREARDGSPDEQEEMRKRQRYLQTVRNMARIERRIGRLVLQLEHSMGERLPNNIRSRLPMGGK